MVHELGSVRLRGLRLDTYDAMQKGKPPNRKGVLGFHSMQSMISRP